MSAILRTSPSRHWVLSYRYWSNQAINPDYLYLEGPSHELSLTFGRQVGSAAYSLGVQAASQQLGGEGVAPGGLPVANRAAGPVFSARWGLPAGLRLEAGGYYLFKKFEEAADHARQDHQIGGGVDLEKPMGASVALTLGGEAAYNRSISGVSGEDAKTYFRWGISGGLVWRPLH